MLPVSYSFAAVAVEDNMQPAKRSNTRKRIKRQKANAKMVGALSDEQIAAYEEAFRMFDRNDDGQIEFSEMKLVFEMMGDKDMSDAKIRQGISAVDVDGDQTIDLEEFIGMMEAKMGGKGRQGNDEEEANPDTELRAVFDVFDKDGDGSITAEEIHNGRPCPLHVVRPMALFSLTLSLSL